MSHVQAEDQWLQICLAQLKNCVVCMQELPTSRAQVDSLTSRTQNMLPPPRQAAQLLSRDTTRSTPIRYAWLPAILVLERALSCQAYRCRARSCKVSCPVIKSGDSSGSDRAQSRRSAILHATFRKASHTTKIYAHRDPRTQRQPYSDDRAMPRRQSRLSSRPAQQAQQPEASTSASIPIVNTRPLPAYRRKDADGGLGEKPAPEEQVILHCFCSLCINKTMCTRIQCYLLSCTACLGWFSSPVRPLSRVMPIGTCIITQNKDAAEGSTSAGARSLLSGLCSSVISLCFPRLSDLVSILLVLCLKCTLALQPQDAQPGIPFDQFVVREPARVRRLELEPSGAPERLQYGAPAQAQQVQFGADRSGYPELRPSSRQYDTSERSASQQSGQPRYRDSGRSSKSSAAGVS